MIIILVLGLLMGSIEAQSDQDLPKEKGDPKPVEIQFSESKFNSYALYLACQAYHVQLNKGEEKALKLKADCVAFFEQLDSLSTASRETFFTKLHERLDLKDNEREEIAQHIFPLCQQYNVREPVKPNCINLLLTLKGYEYEKRLEIITSFGLDKNFVEFGMVDKGQGGDAGAVQGEGNDLGNQGSGDSDKENAALETQKEDNNLGNQSPVETEKKEGVQDGEDGAEFEKNQDTNQGGQGGQGAQDEEQGGQDGAQGRQDGAQGGQDHAQRGQDGAQGGQDDAQGGQDGAQGGQD